MARFIDADKLIAHLKDEIEGCKQPFGSRANGKGIAYGTELGLKSAISFANTLATADVVPKSEVEKWFRECEELQGRMIELESEVAREIFEEIEKDSKYAISFVENHKSYSEEVMQAKLECYKDIQNYITELKKKYTESEGKT